MPRPSFYRSLAPLLPWPALAKPLDVPAAFGRRAPLELEIGPGNGEYLAALAAARPEHDFLAVELLWGRVKKCLRKLGGAGLSNARLVCGPVRPVLDYLIAPESLAAVHTLFPCPWPGDEAGRSRLYRQDFLRLVNNRLTEGGTVCLVTDDRPYFDWVLGQLPDTGFAGEAREVGADYGTKFERKWRQGGQETFFRLDLVKVRHLVVPPRKESPMRCPVLPRFDAATFRLPQKVEAAPGTPPEEALRVVAKELLFDEGRRQGMLRVVVVEPGLSQELWLEIDGLPDGRYRVAPARACHALLTDGVQLALDLVAEAALEEPAA